MPVTSDPALALAQHPAYSCFIAALYSPLFPDRFIQQAGLVGQKLVEANQLLPQLMFYWDLTPADVHLGYAATKNHQAVIQKLHEGALLHLKSNKFGNGWAIYTQLGQEIGGLSRRGTEELSKKQIKPNQFQFQQSEVTVRSIYRHLKIDDVTGNISEDWFVVIPQIRVCR